MRIQSAQCMFTLSTVEVNPCDSSPCVMGDCSSDSHGVITCACHPGASGDYCEEYSYEFCEYMYERTFFLARMFD